VGRKIGSHTRLSSSPDIAVQSSKNTHLDWQADTDVVHRRVDRVGDEPDVGFVGELYHRHDVRRVETRVSRDGD
jgi:hypothetical protein